ncbi:MAG TPA: hypothetical protein VFL86_11220 [Burkholderiaceae bacterium]|nr:hypothetical protein [Burkholderiaceae bacterium]
MTLCVAGAALAAPATATATDEKKAARLAAQLAAELAQACPVADPGDRAAHDNCRQGLFFGSGLTASLADFVLWGRQRNASLTLKETPLTQLGPDAVTNMYLSLFMFNGRHSVEYVEAEGLYRIRLQTAFRNRLPPGNYAYPFWHDADKWATYQNANEVLLWWDPAKDKIRVLQFTALGPQAPLLRVAQVAHAFDGKWMWTDAQGRTQPKVSVFDGLFEPANPHLARVEATYKALALRLREGQCNDCHVPSNPDKSRRLVLLQTPAHAAAEIKRLLKSVRTDRMPRDAVGIEQPLDPLIKAALLEDGAAFDAALDDARRWEAEQGAALRMARGPFPRLPMPALTEQTR